MRDKDLIIELIIFVFSFAVDRLHRNTNYMLMKINTYSHDFYIIIFL